MKVLVNELNKDQMTRVLEYFRYYEKIKDRKIRFISARGITGGNTVFYKEAFFEIDNEEWEKKGPDLNDVFYQGNYDLFYTIENKVIQKTK